jgi:hypothetical protein
MWEPEERPLLASILFLQTVKRLRFLVAVAQLFGAGHLKASFPSRYELAE